MGMCMAAEEGRKPRLAGMQRGSRMVWSGTMVVAEGVAGSSNRQHPPRSASAGATYARARAQSKTLRALWT